MEPDAQGTYLGSSRGWLTSELAGFIGRLPTLVPAAGGYRLIADISRRYCC